MVHRHKPSALSIVGFGLLGAVIAGIAHYLAYEVAAGTAHAFATVVSAISWLLLIWTVVLMVLWAVNSVSW